jgi:hypothetical protein
MFEQDDPKIELVHPYEKQTFCVCQFSILLNYFKKSISCFQNMVKTKDVTVVGSLGIFQKS